MGDKIIQDTQVLQDIANSIRGDNSIEEEDKILVKDYADRITALKNIVEGNLENLYIPYGVSHIREYAFLQHQDLKNVYIKNIPIIGRYAFGYCHNIKNLNISKVNKISSYAFFLCDGIENIMFKDVSTIENYTFASCSSIKELILPSTLTYIGDCAFDNCISIKKVAVSEGSTPLNLSYRIFRSCYSLEEISLPNNLSILTYGMFWDCSSLKSINLPDNLSIIGQGAFYGAGLKNIYIKNKVERIDQGAFYHCYDLEKMIIEEGSKALTIDGAIAGLQKLSYVYLPKNVTSINTINFKSMKSDGVIDCGFSEGAVTGAPWGAPEGVIINYNVEQKEGE